jgi:hypothetical protein
MISFGCFGIKNKSLPSHGMLISGAFDFEHVSIDLDTKACNSLKVGQFAKEYPLARGIVK